MTTESSSPIRLFVERVVRKDLGSFLAQEVRACAEDGGGVVAMIGMPGTGKSMLAQEFVNNTDGAKYFDGLIHQTSVLPELNGIAVIDEVWKFTNAPDAIAAHVNQNTGVVVALACVLSELEALCGGHIKAVIKVSHLRSPAAQIENKPITDKRSGRRKIKFRGPTGESWSGVGRTPGWLMALEFQGHPRDAFLVDSPVDLKSTKG